MTSDIIAAHEIYELPIEDATVLARLESVIDGGLAGFRRVGMALTEIRDRRLYRGTHSAFGDYLIERWGMHRAHAARMISAVQIADQISDCLPGETLLPANEKQVREIARLPEAQRAEAWVESVERSGGKQPSVALVAEVVREAKGLPPALTSSASDEHYTPAPYVDAARELMGGIDLDPASCEMANRTVRATKICTREDDGLASEWAGRVWLNPPYGTTDGASNQRRWTESAIGRHARAEIAQAVILVGARTGDGWFRPLWGYPICFTDHRIKFETPTGSGDQPTQGSALVYLGDDVARFVEIFSRFGQCVVPRGDHSEAM